MTIDDKSQSDRTLLELAAKAEDIYDILEETEDGFEFIGSNDLWNPLTDDGDALRLAVKLNIVVWEYAQYKRAMAEVRYGAARGEYWELGDDQYAATRRAIVRAAAKIGESM